MMRGLLMFLVGLSYSSAVYAWGPTGHRVTGDIAERYLTDEARAAVISILEPGESLAEASFWFDEMRASDHPFFRTAGPWHYIHQIDGIYDGPPEVGNAFTALERFESTLKSDTATREDRQIALRGIIHIVGDLHQPLHLGTRPDRGGNDVRVKWFGQDSNLHTVWDIEIIRSHGLSYSEFADNLVRRHKANPQHTPITDISIWRETATRLQNELVYEIGDGNLSWVYQFKALPVVKSGLLQGGLDIAAVLNDIFK